MAKKEEAKATQQFVEIEGVKDGVLILKNGGLRQILMVSGLNFDLKSEEEQGLILFSYQNFLNGLSFPIQAFVHSRKLNIEDYLAKLGEIEVREPNELLKNQITEYREFIKSFVSENAIMEKTFFTVVPFDPVQIPQAGLKITEKILSFLPGRPSITPTGAEAEKARRHHMEQLTQRVNQVVSGLGQIGLQAVLLNDEQLIELFYNLYNPKEIEKGELQIAKNE